jgi:hypothetical protein
MPKTVSIKEICGNKITTRDDGLIINEILKNYWNHHDEIVIDFNNIPIASVSFLDQAIGVLALERELAEVRAKLHYKNISSFDLRLLEDILTSRAMQRCNKTQGGKRVSGAKSARKVFNKKQISRRPKKKISEIRLQLGRATRKKKTSSR